ncbi:MAG: hypothetical protein ACP5SH_21360 [Syntrophobacteraceae bacterium]
MPEEIGEFENTLIMIVPANDASCEGGVAGAFNEMSSFKIGSQKMLRRLVAFTRTTLIGGVLIVAPIYISVLLLAKAIGGVVKLIAPVTARIPSSMEFRQVAALLVIVCVCFLAGLVVRTRPGIRAKNTIENNLLERIPGYSLLRGLAVRVAGMQEGQIFAAALVELEEAFVPAFIVEQHDDGAYTVFVPSVPTPAAGTIYILPEERVHLVDVSFVTAAKVVSRWGEGSRELRAAMKKAVPLPGTKEWVRMEQQGVK